MRNILPPQTFVSYLLEFEKLDSFSLLDGRRIEKNLGVPDPPFPDGLQPGALISTFNHFPDCVESENDKVFLEARSREMRNGFFHFMRQRWPETVPSKLRLPGKVKPLGRWYESLYSLCLDVAPYIPLDAENRADGPALFHFCVKEILLGNGVMAMLDLLYPPVTKKQARNRSAGTKNKRRSGEYLESVVTRIRRLEPPQGDELGYFGTLLSYAVEKSAGDRRLRTGALKEFGIATREYAKSTASKNYGTVRANGKGDMVLDRGPKAANIKLSSETAGTHTFQEVSVFLTNQIISMQT